MLTESLQTDALAEAIDEWNWKQLLQMYEGLHQRRRAQEEKLLTQHQPAESVHQGLEGPLQHGSEPGETEEQEEEGVEPSFSWNVAPECTPWQVPHSSAG